MNSVCRHFWQNFQRQGTLVALSVFHCGVSIGAEQTAPPSTPKIWTPDSAGFQKTVAPFLKQHCERCHGSDVQEGRFRIDQNLPNDFFSHSAKEKWGEVANVLGSHEMPPKDEPQPSAAEAATVTDWIRVQMLGAERLQRSGTATLRRLNRTEYRNTIRDLTGVEFDVSGFPLDALAGGFNNNGAALSTSPLLMELYVAAAAQILDRALVSGPQPNTVRWRFEVDTGNDDGNRIRLDERNNPIVNGGENPVENGFKVLHHNAWNKTLNARDFRVPVAGDYIVRVRAGGKVPSREAIVTSARKILEHRREGQLKENPGGKQWHDQAFEADLKHFETSPVYDYGSPRLKLTVQLGPQPRTVGEFDVPASVDNPAVYEFKTRFTTESAGVTVEYAYDVPTVSENFWLQSSDVFERPVAYVDWMEIEGPVYDSSGTEKAVREKPAPEAKDRNRDASKDVKKAAKKNAKQEMKPGPGKIASKERPAANSTENSKANDGEPWPPKSHRLLLPDPIPKPAQLQAEAARKALSAFMEKAYRRPVSPTEVMAKLSLYEGARKDGADFLDAIKLSFTAVLASPDFLFLSEGLEAPASAGKPGAATAAKKPKIPVAPKLAGDEGERDSPNPVADQPRRLTEYQLANRLSYFLWSTMPDDELFRLAAAGKLREPAILKVQLLRMLDDPKSNEFIVNFADQWLGLRDVGANPPATDLFPQYDRHLETSMVAESRAFFRHILQNDASVLDFVSSDYVVINERLARFYGIGGVKGDEFRQVSVPEGVERGGLVTQASMLCTTSNGTRTSPVKRGTWIMKNILGVDPGLPVANAGDIAPKVPGIDNATVRQRLEIHRTLPLCARCHSKIDPLGFALENFNASGEYRRQEGFGYKGRIDPNDPLIDASSQLPDGTPIVGVTGLRNAILAKEDLFLACLTRKLFTYALGRELGLADDAIVAGGVQHLKSNGYRLKDLLLFIISSDEFQSR